MPEKWARTQDVELWTEDLGAASAPPLLLVMGANASAMTWPDALLDALAEGGHRVLRYDHRDTGRSTTRDFSVRPYGISDLARDALAVLDAHGVGAAHVVGFSMGATIGQLLALDHRERLSSLTLVAGAAIDVDFLGNIARSLRGEKSPDGLPVPSALVLSVLGKRAEPPADREAALDRRVEEWRALAGTAIPFDPLEFRRLEERAMDHAGTFAQPRNHAYAAPVPLSRGAELARVTTPTLVVQPPCDRLNPPPHGRHLAELIPGAKLVEVPGMGHALPRAVCEPLARVILAHTRGR